jgi:DNA-binding transcriptional LysR family regulator
MIPRTTLEQWSVLQAIVEQGSYAKAAEALHRSQSSISYMVARLQEQLGVELLAIEGRKARLTERGAVLLRRATELLADARRLEQLAGSLREGREAEVRLAADVAFPVRLLLDALARFALIAPTTRVQLKEVVLSGADEALLDQSADLVIGSRVPPGFLGDVLLEIEFVAVARPDHPLHQLGREITVDDLVHGQQIVIRDSGTVKPRDEGWLGAAQRWTVTGIETSISLVAGGLGFAWLPCHLIGPYIEANTLKPLPLREGQRRRGPLYLMYAQPELAGPATRELAQVLREVVAQSNAAPDV